MTQEQIIEDLQHIINVYNDNIRYVYEHQDDEDFEPGYETDGYSDAVDRLERLIAEIKKG